MVGIVIVSHSYKVSDGIKDLAMQMSVEGQKIISAGGMVDGSIGTDAIRISEAIQEAFSEDGVVVLVDLGSAILSTSTALELLDEEISEKVHLLDAPILEGAISATIASAMGQTCEQVIEAANAARNMEKL